jgi:hypothetical protein
LEAAFSSRFLGLAFSSFFAASGFFLASLTGVTSFLEGCLEGLFSAYYLAEAGFLAGSSFLTDF